MDDECVRWFCLVQVALVVNIFKQNIEQLCTSLERFCLLLIQRSFLKDLKLHLGLTFLYTQVSTGTHIDSKESKANPVLNALKKTSLLQKFLSWAFFWLQESRKRTLTNFNLIFFNLKTIERATWQCQGGVGAGISLTWETFFLPYQLSRLRAAKALYLSHFS